MIKGNINHFSVRMMCRLLSVSSRGCYDWRNRPLSKRVQENAILAAKIKSIFDEGKERSGAKCIAKRLALQSIRVNRCATDGYLAMWQAAWSKKSRV